MWHLLRSMRERNDDLSLRVIAPGGACPARRVTAEEPDARLGRAPGTTLRRSGVAAALPTAPGRPPGTAAGPGAGVMVPRT